MRQQIWVVCFLAVFLALFWLSKQKPVNFKPIYQLPPPNAQTFPATKNSTMLLMNRRNSSLKSIIYPHLIVEAQGFSLDSKILYEKPHHFRMVNYSFLGKECDVGSNDQYFWFWSRRMTPSALFYAQHADVLNVKLKAPFNPYLISDILGINELDLTDGVIIVYQNKLALIKSQLSTNHERVIKICLIDSSRMAVVGHYLYGANGQPLCSAEIVDFYNIDGFWLPKTVVMRLIEEKIDMVWKLDPPTLNSPINQTWWALPEITPKVNLNSYLP